MNQSINQFPHEPNLNERKNKQRERMYEYFLGSFPPRRDALRRRDVRRVVVWGTTRPIGFRRFSATAVVKVKVAPDQTIIKHLLSNVLYHQV